MPLIVKDRVRQTTTTVGTGTITLSGSVVGFQSFSVIGDGNTTYYTIADGATGDWEVGIGTYTSSGTTLSRDTVLESSNAGALVPFSAGTKDVFVTYPAEKSVYMDANNDVSGYDIENSPIGGTTPAAGTFTTLTATGTSYFGGSATSRNIQVDPVAGGTSQYTLFGRNTVNNAQKITAANTSNLYLQSTGGGAILFNTGDDTPNQFRVTHTASAVNYVQVTGAATGSGPIVSAQGSDTNLSLSLNSKGSGTLNFVSNSGTNFRVAGVVVSAVNYFEARGNLAGNQPVLVVEGNDSNINVRIRSKGTGNFQIETGSGGNVQFQANHTASAVNYVQVTGAATGSGPILSAQGSDTNIPLVLQPKGTGALQAQQTDSTATGGNARGANAVDWQTSRGNANQVASGQYSVLGGGYGNRSSAYGNFVGGGESNLASGYDAAVLGGASQQATGGYATAGGGLNNIASGSYAGVLGGYFNTASGYNTFIGGGERNSGASSSAVTTQATTTVTNGSTAVTLSGSNANIKVGQLITGTGIVTYPNQTYVTAISGTSLTLSQNANATGSPTLSFFTPNSVVVGGGNNQATGSYSFIGGGGDAGTAANRNVASGDWSFVGGGMRNTASGLGSVVVGGGTWDGTPNANTASGTVSVICGGYSNTATSFSSAVLGGVSNSANGQASTIVGGVTGISRGIVGYTVFPACNGAISFTQGTHQSALLILARQTTDATPTVLTSNSSAAGTTNQVILPNNSAYYFKGSVIANVTGAANGAAWSIEGAIMRGANAASTVLIGTPAVNRISASAGATAWTVAITADTTNGGIAITVTGAAATTIRWVARMNTTEVTF